MSPPRIPRPERAENTVLAALLAVLLAVMLAAQVVLPLDRPEVPGVPPAAGLRRVTADVPRISPDAVLARRSIFTPVALVGASGDNAAPRAPLDGAVPAGTVRIRGAVRLVLQTPEGKAVTLRPGQSFRGWRLTAIGREEASFRRAGESVTLAFGAATSFFQDDPYAYDPRDFGGGFRANQADEQ